MNTARHAADMVVDAITNPTMAALKQDFDGNLKDFGR
jgi:hypothetical protein